MVIMGIACGLPSMTVLACGADSHEAAPPSADNGPLVARADGRAVVADVDGVPIYEDCPVRHARDSGLDIDAALERCIAIELLAREAQRRGLGRDPEVVWAGRREAVRALLDQQIVAPMPSLEGTARSVLEDAYERYRDKIFAPERRRIFHLFAPFPEVRERPGSDADKRARAFADELYAAVAGRRGLTEDELLRVAREVAGERPLGPVNKNTGEFKREVFKVFRDQPDLPRGFSHAAMDIPEPGMVSPPARSDYGWHLILYLDGEPARYANVDQAAEYLFQAVRSERYWNFTGALMKAADVRVAETALVRMQEREDALSQLESAPSDAGARP